MGDWSQLQLQMLELAQIAISLLVPGLSFLLTRQVGEKAVGSYIPMSISTVCWPFFLLLPHSPLAYVIVSLLASLSAVGHITQANMAPRLPHNRSDLRGRTGALFSLVSSFAATFWVGI